MPFIGFDANRRRARRSAVARRLLGLATAVAASLVLPGVAAAHPLGNFTINHYAGVRIEPDRILLDVVIDEAEIPAFQARLTFDADGDGELSADETDVGRLAACESLAGSLDLRVNGKAATLQLTEAGLTFPPGAGGLSTMRSVCGFAVPLATPVGSGDQVDFADRSFAERLGWREIVVSASGLTLASGSAEAVRTTSPSNRLTAYPVDLLTRALADTEVVVSATPGGPELPALDIVDATPVPGAVAVAAQPAGASGGVDSAPPAAVVAPAAAVPGGVSAGDLPAIFRAADLTPIVLLVSVLTAAALGAGHALTPGHGKTLMAAYLVGTRGTPVHAAGLGLSVALSHTIGILALAGVVVGAQGVLPPEVVVRTAPVVAAISIVAIGGWMLLGELRRRRRASGLRLAQAAVAHPHDHDHPHHEEHATGHEHDAGHAHDHGGAHAHEPQQHDQGHEHPHADDHPSGEHSHGGIRHSHLPPSGTSITWRSLFVLGLAGGLIPSASALLILLGSIAAGRPAFGFVLVVAFGLGMALVMSGIGLALVVARSRLDRVDTGTWLGRAGSYLPLIASCLVLGVGLYLTLQAVSGATTL